MKYRLASGTGTFLVLDTSKINVGRANLLLRTSRASWFVLQQNDKYFVLSSSELRKMLEPKKPTTLLLEALKLHQFDSSHVLSSASAALELAQKPDDSKPAGRAIVLRRVSNGDDAIYSAGRLVAAIVRKVNTTSTTVRSGIKQAPGRPNRTLGGVARKSTVKKAHKAPAKKAAAKKAVYRSPGRLRGVEGPPRSFSLGFGRAPSTGAAKPKTEKPISTSEVIDVLFATDRESKATTTTGALPGFLNRLPDKADLSYGICHVSVPKRRSLGKIELPSVWTFWAKTDPQKYFNIKGYEPLSWSTFSNLLHDRVGRSEGKSCFVFIHGYNVSFDDAAMRTAQLSCDLKFLGVPILYSWASAADGGRYSKDEETVGLTIKRLTAFLTKLVQSSGAEQIHLIAHSMGNRALVNALDRLALQGDLGKKPFSQVVLTAPDVPRKDVESLIKAASDKAERVTLYASSKDKALGLSKARHDYERLGKVYGYPYVLEGMDSIDASNVKTDFWGHSVFAKTRSVLGDLSALIAEGKPPRKRFGLRPLDAPGGTAWAIES
ncbi:alpha/beta hydrolase [Tunturiibacter gelidiferens]|uniref:alpha/beta hydrolase n=1 Tax=Tunturiibacter gelidiferens TaxID=3069689 RepID=UPI003D9BB40B